MRTWRHASNFFIPDVNEVRDSFSIDVEQGQRLVGASARPVFAGLLSFGFQVRQRYCLDVFEVRPHDAQAPFGLSEEAQGASDLPYSGAKQDPLRALSGSAMGFSESVLAPRGLFHGQLRPFVVLVEGLVALAEVATGRHPYAVQGDAHNVSPDPL